MASRSISRAVLLGSGLTLCVIVFSLLGAACEQGVRVREIGSSRSPFAVQVSVVEKGACAQNAKAENCAQDYLIDAHVETRVNAMEVCIAVRRPARAYTTPNLQRRQSGFSRIEGCLACQSDIGQALAAELACKTDKELRKLYQTKFDTNLSAQISQQRAAADMIANSRQIRSRSSC